MGFKGRALLPRRLLKDPELLLIMPSRVPETPALTHSQNLLFPPSEQEFKPETHLRLPQPEATRSRDRLSPQPPAPLSRTRAPYRGLCLVEHKCPKTRAPTSRATWPGRSPSSSCHRCQPLAVHGDAASTTPHHPHPHELGPRLNTSHYARFSRCPDECLHLFGAAAPGEKQRWLCQPCQPESCAPSLQLKASSTSCPTPCLRASRKGERRLQPLLTPQGRHQAMMVLDQG